MHRLAVAIAKGIGLEVAEQGDPPSQPRRARSSLLPERQKYRSRSCPLRPRRQQAKVAHGLSIAVGDVFRKQGDKPCRCASGFPYALRPGVLDLVDNFLI